MAPDPAASEGYNRLVFADDFEGATLSSLWSKECWFLAGATNNDSISIANSFLTLGGGSGSDGSLPDLIRITSAYAVDATPYYAGKTFAGGGYFEARMRFDPSVSGAALNRPAFWSLAIEHIMAPKDGEVAQHWPGKPDHWANYAELDFAESALASEGTDHYLGAVHNWNGLNGANDYLNTNYQVAPTAPDWSIFHTYGVLWVPQSGVTPGRVEYYFDNVLMSAVFYKGPADDITETVGTVTVDQSTVELANLPFSILDQNNLAIALQADVNWPVDVDWVRVWQ